jgi:hypothetical protein
MIEGAKSAIGKIHSEKYAKIRSEIRRFLYTKHDTSPNLTRTSEACTPAVADAGAHRRSCPQRRGVGGCPVAIGSGQRRRERRPRIEALFDSREVEAALDLLALTDMAWHDCYGPRELEIPPQVLDDVLLLAHGNLAALTRVALLAVLDFRDVRMAADHERV